MGIPVLIIGKSGSGKSASLRNHKTFSGGVSVVNVIGKPFPFKGKPTSAETDNYDAIKSLLKVSQAKSIVIDDAGYLITDEFMREHSTTGKGNAVFSLYNDIGDHFWGLIEYCRKDLPADKIVYIIMHEDKNDFGDIKPKTIGKMLDEKVCLEGMFSIVLRCIFDGSAHKFVTQSNGYDVAKSPMGMFETLEIDNDLKFVDDRIREFWELGGKSDAKA